MKTYCPHCGALNDHGLIKPTKCAKCNQSLELEATASSVPVKKTTYEPPKAFSQARRTRPKITPRDYSDDDDEEDAEIPENISKIEIEEPRVNKGQRQTVRDIMGKKDGSDSPRPVIKMSKKKQLEELRNESRSARDNKPQEIE